MPEGNQSIASLIGDPHVTGFDGQKFEFVGESGCCYNMLSCGTVQVNVRLVCYRKNKTYISETGIKIRRSHDQEDRIWVGLRDSFLVCFFNGKELAAEQPEEKRSFSLMLKSEDSRTLRGYVYVRKRKSISINTGSYLIVIKKGAEIVKDSVKCPHMNVSFTVNSIGVLSDGIKPHGIVGQTVNETACVEEHEYKVSDLFADDFKFNRFGLIPETEPKFGVGVKQRALTLL